MSELMFVHSFDRQHQCYQILATVEPHKMLGEYLRLKDDPLE